jgi:cytochrome c-type biogenesis protein CcmH/NrfG
LIDQYEKATQTAPQDAQAWHQLGLAYWKAGKTGLAVQCLEQALRLNPDDPALKKWLEDYQAKHPDNP